MRIAELYRLKEGDIVYVKKLRPIDTYLGIVKGMEGKVKKLVKHGKTAKAVVQLTNVNYPIVFKASELQIK